MATAVRFPLSPPGWRSSRDVRFVIGSRPGKRGRRGMRGIFAGIRGPFDPCALWRRHRYARSAQSGALHSDARDSRATYGWNLEMQIKAGRAGRILEVPVTIDAAKACSQSFGTLRGTFVAIFRILATF